MSRLQGNDAPGTEVDEETFYMGVLLALSERARGFYAYGNRYQERWCAVVRKARELGLPYDELQYPYAFEQHESMVLFGMSSCLLTLDSPMMQYARLCWASAEARAKLNGFKHADIFRACASAFLNNPQEKENG